MRSVADTHREALRRENAAMTTEQRVERAFILGDDDLACYAAAQQLTHDSASGVNVEVRRGDRDDPLCGVVRITQQGQRPVDIIVGRHAWQTAIVDAADAHQILGAHVPVVDVPSLILLKLYAGGPQDLWDIDQLPATSRTLWTPFRSRPT
jgi:hypothetical protein